MSSQLAADEQRANEASRAFWRALALPDGSIDRGTALVTCAAILGTLAIKMHVPAEVLAAKMLRILEETD